jgi:hypothetical protein
VGRERICFEEIGRVVMFGRKAVPEILNAYGMYVFIRSLNRMKAVAPSGG